MGEKVRKMRSKPELVPTSISLFRVTVELVTGVKEEYSNVVQFGPIPDKDLLFITIQDGETVVYPLVGNVCKYTFKQIQPEEVL